MRPFMSGVIHTPLPLWNTRLNRCVAGPTVGV